MRGKDFMLFNPHPESLPEAPIYEDSDTFWQNIAQRLFLGLPTMLPRACRGNFVLERAWLNARRKPRGFTRKFQNGASVAYRGARLPRACRGNLILERAWLKARRESRGFTRKFQNGSSVAYPGGRMDILIAAK